MENKQGSYYTKKEVYTTSPLTEIVSEVEDKYKYSPFLDIVYISKEDMDIILERHNETVKEFKKKLANLFDES